MATTGKLLLSTFNNFQLLCVSALLSAIALLVINLVTKKIKTCKNYKPKDYLKMLIAGLPGTFLYYIFYYAGAGLLSFNKDTVSGVVLCLLAAVSYGLFTALSKKENYDSCISMMVNFFATFILTGIIIVVKGDFFTVSLADSLGLLWNGIFTMAIPNTLWLVALNFGSTAKISNLAYITPFLSMLWTTLILKEPFELFSLIGLIIIISGIFVQLKESKNDDIKSKL